MRMFMLAAVAAFSLSACGDLATAINQPVSGVSQSTQDAMNAAKKGLTAAHLLHQAAADAMTAAAKSGALHGAAAATAKTYLDQSEAYLVAADDLVAVGDAAGIEAKVATATALISQVQSLTSQPSN
jgi:hypothetical protein